MENKPQFKMNIIVFIICFIVSLFLWWAIFKVWFNVAFALMGTLILFLIYSAFKK